MLEPLRLAVKITSTHEGCDNRSYPSKYEGPANSYHHICLTAAHTAGYGVGMARSNKMAWPHV